MCADMERLLVILFEEPVLGIKKSSDAKILNELFFQINSAETKFAIIGVNINLKTSV